MKKLYFLFFTILITSLSFGQVFITELADPNDNANARYIELYNAGASVVDLSTWRIDKYTNTSASVSQTLALTGTIPAGGFYIIATGPTDTIVFDTWGITPDQWDTGSNNVAGSNGDDKIELVDNTSTVVDIFGLPGDNANNANNAQNFEDGRAERKASVTTGNSTWDAAEWNVDNDQGFGAGAQNTTGFDPGVWIGTSTSPTITVGAAVSGLDYFEGNGPSNEGTFTVEGINLTADITVAAPTNFEVSLTSGSGFGASVNVAQTAGIAPTTTIYARLAASLTSNSYSGDATTSSSGATNQTVALSGTVSPAVPQITISGFVGSLNYTDGSGPSPEDSFSVEGLFLISEIVVDAPLNFEVSLTSGGVFTSSVSLTPTGETVATTNVFVRLASTLAVGPYSGNVTVSSVAVTDQTLAVDGNVFPLATCGSIGDIIITEVMQNPNAVGDSVGEWFEVYNTTGAPIDMIGWVIKDDTSASETYTIAISVVVPANGYAVFGNNADTGTNGGVTVNHQYDTISLGNGIDGLIIECSSTTIDSVIWDDGTTFPDPTGASMELSTTTLNSVGNDTGSNWAEGTVAFGAGDLGTPSATNSFTLSTNEFDVNKFKLYPNPTSLGYVNISSRSQTTMKVNVFDVLGKQVINETISNNRLNVSSLNTGVYIMRISQDEATITKKLIIN